MQDLVGSIGLAFLLLALVTLALIFRDAFRQLSVDDRTTLRHWIGRKASLQTRAVDNVWKVHARTFPNSRKRFLFVFFLIGSVVIGLGSQIWCIYGHR